MANDDAETLVVVWHRIQLLNSDIQVEHSLDYPSKRMQAGRASSYYTILEHEVILNIIIHMHMVNIMLVTY
jgi:hypothetical protein